MKKAILTLLVMLMVTSIFAQSKYFNYKALITDNGAVVNTQTVNIRFTIYDVSVVGSPVQVFQETHTLQTDENGIVIAKMGLENPTDWDLIDWTNQNLALNVEYDLGNGYEPMGMRRFNYMPYAKYANYAGNVFSGDFNDLTNVPAGLSDGDDDTQLTEAQVDAYVNNNGYATELNELSDAKTTTSSVYVGDGSGNSATGDYNTGLGELSLRYLTTGRFNTGIGRNTLYNLTTGIRNTVVGANAMSSGDFSENTVIGYCAGQNATGNANIFIGKDAGKNATGDNKLYIENSDSNTPLIGGNFSTDEVTINGSLAIKDGSQANGKVLVSDANGKGTWEDLPKIFVVEGTSTAATTTTDNIQHFGNLILGTNFSSVGYGITSLVINRNFNNDNNSYGNLVNISGSGTGDHIGSYNYLIGSGSGLEIGIKNSVISAGDGTHIGTDNALANSGSGTHIAVNNYLYGEGTGLQYGTYNDIVNTKDNMHYGTYNSLHGSGSGAHYGTYNYLYGSGTGDRYGCYNRIFEGNGYGVYNMMSNTNAVAIKNYFSDYTGSQDNIGMETENQNDDTANHYGVINKLFGASTGKQIGIFNSIDNTGYASGYDHIGILNSINGSGGDQHIGMQNTLWGNNDRIQIGVSNEISNSGDAIHYGIKNNLTGTGSGDKFGIYSKISTTAGGSHYAIFGEARKSGSYAGYFWGNLMVDTGNFTVYNTSGNAISVFESASADATVYIKSHGSNNPDVHFYNNGSYKTSMGYNVSEDAFYIYQDGNVFFKDGDILPTGHKLHDLGANGNAWDNVYADNFINQGAAAFTDRSVTEELLLHKPVAKKDGDFDAKTPKGLYELNPASLPDALHTDNALLIDEMASYNYKANYEQQQQIEALKKEVKRLQQENKKLKALEKRLKKLEELLDK